MRSLAPAVIGCALLGAWVTAQESSQGPMFESGVDLVLVDVVVIDGDGNPVTGLSADDFELSEQGQPQVIASFEAVSVTEPVAPPSTPWTQVSTNLEPPQAPHRTFLVVFDDVHLSPVSGKASREVLARFLEDGLLPGDHVMVDRTSGQPGWQGTIPGDRAELLAFVAQLEGQDVSQNAKDRISDWEAMQIAELRNQNVLDTVMRRYMDLEVIHDTTYPVRSGELTKAQQTDNSQDFSPGKAMIQARAAETYNKAKDRMTQTLRDVARRVDALVGEKGRKTVALVSEGFILDRSNFGFRDLVRASRAANAAVYFVDPRAISGMPWTTESDVRRAVQARDVSGVMDLPRLESEGAVTIAADTGGFTIAGNDVGAGLAKMARESGSYYLLGYSPTNPDRDGEYRKISVKLSSRQGLEVRARKGYYAEGGAARGGRAELEAPGRHTAIPLRATSYLFGNAPEGKVSAMLVAEADPKSLTFSEVGGRKQARVETLAVVTPLSGGDPVRKRFNVTIRPGGEQGDLETGWARVLADMELAPGTYQAHIALRDLGSNRMGSVEHRFAVPEPGTMRACSPILTDTFMPAPAGQVGAPIPLARRSFRPGEQLGMYFEVYDAAREGEAPAPVDVGIRMIREDGSTVSSLPTQPLPAGPDGKIGTMVMLPLAGLGEGRYAVALDVRDAGGQGIEVREPFVVGDESRLPPPLSARVGPGAAAGYDALSQAYLGADRASALAQVERWSDGAIRAAIDAARAADSGCDVGCVQAAVLLHTEAAASEARQGRLSGANRHYVAARELLDDPRLRKADGFRARWLVAMADEWRRILDERLLSSAVQLYEQALKIDKDDAEALLGEGSVHETLAFGYDLSLLQTPEGSMLQQAQRRAFQEREAKKAEDAYRKAIKADSGLAEAHLRLGRVLQLRGRDKDARRELGAAAASGDAYVQMLANLLLGQSLMENGEEQAGIARLQLAAAGPSSGRVHLALSHALLRTGHASEAREELARGLEESRATTDVDPWLAYHQGPHRGHGLELLVERMRKEVRS